MRQVSTSLDQYIFSYIIVYLVLMFKNFDFANMVQEPTIQTEEERESQPCSFHSSVSSVECRYSRIPDPSPVVRFFVVWIFFKENMTVACICVH